MAVNFMFTIYIDEKPVYPIFTFKDQMTYVYMAGCCTLTCLDFFAGKSFNERCKENWGKSSGAKQGLIEGNEGQSGDEYALSMNGNEISTDF